MDKEAPPPAPPDRAEPPAASLHARTVPLWVPLVLLVLLIAAVAWRLIGAAVDERRFEAERVQLVQQTETERAAIQAQAQQALATASDDAHVLFGTALAWTVRSALIRMNLDEIDQYIVTLSQHPRIALVLLADTQGQIALASNRALLGTPFGEHFPPALLQATSVTVHPGEGVQRRLVLPIQGLTERLGTMIVVYETPAIPLKN